MNENIYFACALRRLFSSIKLEGCSSRYSVLVPRYMSSEVSVENKRRANDQKELLYGYGTSHSCRNVRFYSGKKSDEVKNVMNFYEFSEIENKDKKTFTKMIELYEEKFTTRKGVVDFILTALNQMKEFNVHEDLATYKRLINLMPKGKYVPENRLQVEGVHFPREQDCITDVLCQMEEYAVIPDVETFEILRSIFGDAAHPVRKYYRMMYWMPKFKNRNPWLLPKPLPRESFALAKLAIEKITSVDLQTEISVYRTEDVEDSIDKTWIISGQSPEQRKLLQKHDRNKPVIVEGGDHVWLRQERINYFVLKSEYTTFKWKPPKSIAEIENMDVMYLNPNYVEEREQSVHEQDDGMIYAVCATGTSTKDSLLSWIRLLEKNGNNILQDLAVLFRFEKPPHQPVPFSDALEQVKSAHN